MGMVASTDVLITSDNYDQCRTLPDGASNSLCMFIVSHQGPKQFAMGRLQATAIGTSFDDQSKDESSRAHVAALGAI
eukprot:3540201-Amphidinium_carterae.2